MLRVLDFWLGTWDVRARDGTWAGANVVERVLDGCAVLEHWRGAAGDEGKSLFYYDGSGPTWKQVWVARGCVKEKQLDVALLPEVRFTGTAYVQGLELPDRTTLTVLPDGGVGQLIEHSRDGGATWTASFDAVYRRT